jgi:hypothetical protein
MTRSKFLAQLFAVMSIMIVGAVTFGIFAIVNAPAHAAPVKALAHVTPKTTGKSKPRFIHFHANFSDVALATSSLKHWSSSFISEGKTWKYSMVGTNPGLGSATTTVPVTIVPLLLKFSNGKIFDGTPQVSSTTSSPLFQNASFISGTTQYGDAIQRAEYWKNVSTKSPNYHVLVGSPTIAKTLTISVPSVDGTTVVDPSSSKTIGIINVYWFDPQIQSLLTSLGFTPNMLPIFLSHNVYLSQGAPNLSNCCIGGYHNAIRDAVGLQTYIWSTESDSTIQGGFGEDVSALSHELLEWLDDPFTTNVVPNWISPIAPQYGCNNALEVGDPLVGVVFTLTAFPNDHLQDIAFYNWFARQSPSTALNGQYSYHKTIKSLSTMC